MEIGSVTYHMIKPVSNACRRVAQMLSALYAILQCRFAGSHLFSKPARLSGISRLFAMEADRCLRHPENTGLKGMWTIMAEAAIRHGRCCAVTGLLSIVAYTLPAQPPLEKYSIKNGKMLIQLSKQLDEVALDSFIAKFDLYDLDLKQFIKTNAPDSLEKKGWTLERNSRDLFIISKLLRGAGNFNNPADKIMFTEKRRSANGLFSAVNKNIQYGYNRFRRKYAFPVQDSLVTFFLRSNNSAQKVMLAGSFTDWETGALPMSRSDSGWIAYVKLGPGKYLYKFIVDGNWMVDNDNATVENDGKGNDNSVFYKPNVIFRLNGFENTKKLFVAGSFNNWQPRELPMTRTTAGWQLPLYLAEGTYTYRFIADGKWMADPANTDRLPNEFNDFNSVIKIGKPHLFELPGYSNAKQVMIAGSFNNWREGELFMRKTANGWELPYTLGPGNYEYRYKVDGKWITGPEKPVLPDPHARQGNAYLIIKPNYTFRLKGFVSAKTVFLAGDFNNWSPNTFAMKQAGDHWLLDVHLSPGKHLYKFVVDGEWIKDTGNNLWEQNEFGTGNSVIWLDQ